MNRSSRIVKLMACREERLKPLNKSSARRRAIDSGGKDKNLKDLRHQLPNIEKGTALTKAVLQIGWLPPKRA
ncbi:hypothetical protein NDU88_002837 [Pleurodeles waltl]|uniref:Uncharacterized protein n=1 Tax=Pleurodeles waltl TaxID=8319 RepID=A0AAV7T4E7_PLEWA|nr:hypothetical protein NDU88_002837 [Pleurodeles waltl]